MKTANLTGPALDWAVAYCEAPIGVIKEYFWEEGYSPSTNWEFGGPIIEQEKIDIGIDWDDKNKWIAGYSILTECMEHEQRGHTPLIAAMRCYVTSKLGNEIEIPKELQ